MDLSLTGAGARIAVKLARKGGAGNWYSDSGYQVAIPHPGGLIRFPKDLDWLATPTDDSGRLAYEWTFVNNPQLNRGHWAPHTQLPKIAYAPRFRATASKQNGINTGPDTVILNVYSFLYNPKEPEWVGSDTVPIEWVQNRPPMVNFLEASLVGSRFKVGCGKTIKKLLLDGSDSDGDCRLLRIFSVNAPSLPKFDTLLSCLPDTAELQLTFEEPLGIPGIIGTDGAEEYENTLIAEIVDDNGEKGRDTVHLRTYRNVPPTAIMVMDTLKDAYLVGDTAKFKVTAHDTDGSFNNIYVSWAKTNNNQSLRIEYMSDVPRGNYVKFSGSLRFFQPESSTQIWATVVDECNGKFQTQPIGVGVYESRPPSISRILARKLPTEGDTLRVSLEFTVTDPDAGQFGDRISWVRADWPDGTSDTESDPSSASTWKMEHKYVPASGSPLAIRILAMDMHNSLADTTYLFAP
jgi:hypothetical protein